ncbi:Arc family DNA-binding protein [Pelagibacterium halotolerans]|uniref:Arc family DNA-binding protein n=1 Tax=Pelagibacterium halotolerans TaxID=531813 RepID=UPI00384D3319
MSRTDPQMMIRVPADLKERIRKSAECNRRSMVGEIVYTLEQALPASETETAPGGEIAAKTPDAAEA